MYRRRSFVIVPSLLAALALPLMAAEKGIDSHNAGVTPNTGADTLSSKQAVAEQKLIQARAAFQAAQFIEARELVDLALANDPAVSGGIELRSNILAVLDVRSNRLQMAAEWFRSMQDVKTQELAVRLQSLEESGDQKMKSGDYAGAELDYDRVDTGLRSFPNRVEKIWGDLPQKIQNKRANARLRAQETSNSKQAEARNAAADEAARQAKIREEALKNKVDELLRRARTAMSRKDFKRAEIDAWNAYELDRRRDDARDVYLKAREGGHDQFDDEFREQRLERLARVHEEIHKEMIPQNELLVYPEDWNIRALRKPQELRNKGEEEAWMVALRASLEQRIDTTFNEESFDVVIAYLQKVSGVNFVVAPDVAAGGAPNVNLNVKNMRLDDVLKWVTQVTGLKYTLYNQAVYISKTALQGSIAMHMYDVTDLVSPPRDFPGKELGYAQMNNAGGGGAGAGPSLFAGGAGATDAAVVISPDKLKEFIQLNVASESWSAEGVGMDARGTMFFISQSPEVHQQIEDTFTFIRNQQNLQVKLDVKLLDVRKGFMEEIGVNFNDPPANPTGSINGLINHSSNGANQTIPTAGGVSSTTSGYQRLNPTSAYVGNVYQNMPDNKYQGTSGLTGQQRGLSLDLAYHPYSFVGIDQVNAMFTAMEEETDSTIVLQPELAVFNGQRANTTFINQYAYIADYDVMSSTYSPKISVLNTGNMLDVRPIVSSDRKYITLEMRPASVDFAGSTIETLITQRGGNGNGNGNGGGNFNNQITLSNISYSLELPMIEVRSLRTTVMIPDKGTLILGGYTKALRQNTHSGVPFLSHIPFLGRLFSKNGVYDQNRRLFFMLSAEIFDQQEREKLR